MTRPKEREKWLLVLLDVLLLFFLFYFISFPSTVGLQLGWRQTAGGLVARDRSSLSPRADTADGKGSILLAGTRWLQRLSGVWSSTHGFLSVHDVSWEASFSAGINHSRSLLRTSVLNPENPRFPSLGFWLRNLDDRSLPHSYLPLPTHILEIYRCVVLAQC